MAAAIRRMYRWLQAPFALPGPLMPRQGLHAAGSQCISALEQTSEEAVAFSVIAEKAVDYNDKYYEPDQAASVVIIITVTVLEAFFPALLLAAVHSFVIVSHIKTSVFFIIL